jgi:hypothetical protein
MATLTARAFIPTENSLLRRKAKNRMRGHSTDHECFNLPGSKEASPSGARSHSEGSTSKAGVWSSRTQGPRCCWPLCIPHRA